MCGIVGYIGSREAAPILLNGLRRLEYRGYDSAGLALVQSDKLVRYRAVGRIAQLTDRLTGADLSGTLGVAHTRWATHGGVTEPNAHPHVDCSGRLMLAHNGIIENYRELKERLQSD